MSARCLESARTPSSRYPLVRVGKRMVPEHRLVWEQANGPIPEGAFICHHCDNSRCVNLEHLYLGNALTNNRDSFRRMRHPDQHRQTCLHGHPLDGVKRHRDSVTRYCLTCNRDMVRAFREAQRAC